MSEGILDSELFKEGIKKVGPGSEFRYRCIFDPTPVSRENTSSDQGVDDSD